MAFITRLFKNSKTLLFTFTLLLLCPMWAAAEGIDIIRSTAVLTSSGQLNISSRFKTELPDQLQQALQQGVPLYFTLNYQLSAPSVAAYKSRISQLVGSESSVSYKLSFHPLTNRYRVTVGTFYSEFNSLETALRGIGAIANWRVLPSGTLNKVAPTNIRAEVRLSLSTSQLPKPFQINAFTAKNWQLDSGWKSLTISGG